MQYTGPTSISKFKQVINANDLVPGAGLQASGRTWATKAASGNDNSTIIAKISNTGPLGTENDYPDYHYWVIPQQNNVNISSGAFIPGGKWNLSDIQNSNLSNIVLTAVNPGEYQTSSHSLAIGSIVELLPVYIDQTDGTAPAISRWVIVTAGAPVTTLFVTLSMDGGSDGITATQQEATYTYTCNDVNTGAQIAVQVPLYGHRAEKQNGTIPASKGTLIKVTNPANIGYGGAQDIAINDGNGYGYTGTGSGSGAPSGSTDQPWRLWECDEQFAIDPCTLGSGSGS